MATTTAGGPSWRLCMMCGCHVATPPPSAYGVLTVFVPHPKRAKQDSNRKGCGQQRLRRLCHHHHYLLALHAAKATKLSTVTYVQRLRRFLCNIASNDKDS